MVVKCVIDYEPDVPEEKPFTKYFLNMKYTNMYVREETSFEPDDRLVSISDEKVSNLSDDVILKFFYDSKYYTKPYIMYENDSHSIFIGPCDTMKEAVDNFLHTGKNPPVYSEKKDGLYMHDTKTFVNKSKSIQFKGFFSKSTGLTRVNTLKELLSYISEGKSILHSIGTRAPIRFTVYKVGSQ